MTRLTLIAACLTCSLADAQCVRIVTSTPEGPTVTLRSYGSGTVVGKLRDGNHAVLTAAHTVRTATHVSVIFPADDDTVNNPAKVLLSSYDKESDVALLSVRLVGVRAVARVAPAFPRQTVQVNAEGFPQRLTRRRIRCLMEGDILMEPSEPIEEGMSGGGVFLKGELVGVITGRIVGRRDGWHTPSRFIAPWIQSELGYIPN